MAYALAGTMDIDLVNDPIATDAQGVPVYLKDLWPTQKEVTDTIAACVGPEQFIKEYADVADGNAQWNDIPVKGGELFAWDEASTYIQEPPFFTNLTKDPAAIAPIAAARVLVMVGDSVTTDHISPAGDIKKNGPAGKYLADHGVGVLDFNSYGQPPRQRPRDDPRHVRQHPPQEPARSRTEGGVTTYLPTGTVESIYDASMKYQADKVPLVVLAGKDYGMGSSRDWAAKGVYLLGVKVVMPRGFERIHRSNLVGMGVLPLVYKKGQTRTTLGLTGHETFAVTVGDDLKPGQDVAVSATAADGTAVEFTTTCRIDTPVEIEYYRNGGILHTVLRNLMKK